MSFYIPGNRFVKNTSRLELLNLPKGKFFPPPPFIEKVVRYQDVNNDKNLRKNVTTDFYNKTIKKISKDKEYKHLKKYLKKLKSDVGYEIVYKLIKIFVKNTGMNWYDLRSKYDLVLRFILHKLGKY
jgi:hypothetical protein